MAPPFFFLSFFCMRSDVLGEGRGRRGAAGVWQRQALAVVADSIVIDSGCRRPPSGHRYHIIIVQLSVVLPDVHSFTAGAPRHHFDRGNSAARSESSGHVSDGSDDHGGGRCCEFVDTSRSPAYSHLAPSA